MFKKTKTDIHRAKWKSSISETKPEKPLSCFLGASTHLRKTEKAGKRLAWWVVKRQWFTACTPHYFTISFHRSITIYAHTVIGRRLHTDTVKCLFPPGDVTVKGLASSPTLCSPSFYCLSSSTRFCWVTASYYVASSWRGVGWRSLSHTEDNILHR